MAGTCDAGVYGLAVMGLNLSLNICSRGFRVCVCNRTEGKVDVAVQLAQQQGLPASNYIATKTMEDFVRALRRPRRIVMMIQAGPPVDALIDHLLPLLEEGDCLVDGGNEFFENTERREKECAAKGILYMGLGVSGGEEGARYGPSLMPGGSAAAWEVMKPILVRIAARIDPQKGVQQQGKPAAPTAATAATAPTAATAAATAATAATAVTKEEMENACVTHIGPGGAGHYVKMVHNGIEYGDMQLIAEAYYMLKNRWRLSNPEIHDIFNRWDQGELRSYLIEITSKILLKKDTLSNGYLLDQIRDTAGSKGTGKWTVQQAAEAGVAIPTIATALDIRYISGDPGLREMLNDKLRSDLPHSASKKSSTPWEAATPNDIADVEHALLCGKICCYAQGLQLLASVSRRRNWNLNLAEICRIWKGGCIIRAKLLDILAAAFLKNPSLQNALLDEQIAKMVKDRLPALQRTMVNATLPLPRQKVSPLFLPVACHCTSLSYLAAMSTTDLPTNLIQAQRDCFGAHTFKRKDREGTFHEEHWTE